MDKKPDSQAKAIAETPTRQAESEAQPKQGVKEASLAEIAQDPEELIKPLKELITALERRQKIVQEMGDYRTVLQSLVSGDLLSGEELERAKQVIQSLGKLVKATIDHQNALATASEVMPALDKILGVQSKKMSQE
ncbi:MAG: hypothetical protein KME16_02365 [Scytolyngbya sp. HA4215-MV1]|jgi:chorismate mutase|nr:hypothetical protein [Scytolyngbya sp. HA4215-MV1]